MCIRRKTGNRYNWILVDFRGAVVVHGLWGATIDRVRGYSILRPLLSDPGYAGTIEVDHGSASRDSSSAANKMTRVLILQVILRRWLEGVPILSRFIALAIDDRLIGVIDL